MTNFFPFLTYVLVTTFTPGPNNIMSMTNGTQNGYRKMWKFLAGIFTGFVIVMLASGLLNVVLTGLLPSIEGWLKLLGVIYMGYLAYHVARSRPVEDAQDQSPFNTFWFGFSMQFLNVKGILYGVTVFSLFIVHTYRDPASILGFSVLLAVIGLISTSLWAVGGNIFRIFLRKNYRVFNFAMAGLLIYTAVASLI